MARVRFYRHTELCGIVQMLHVFVDGRKVGDIPYEGEQTIEVTEGRHEVYVTMFWLASRPFSFIASEKSTIELECVCTGGVFTGLLDPLFRPREYFTVRIPTAVQQVT